MGYFEIKSKIVTALIILWIITTIFRWVERVLNTYHFWGSKQFWLDLTQFFFFDFFHFRNFKNSIVNFHLLIHSESYRQCFFHFQYRTISPYSFQQVIVTSYRYLKHTCSYFYLIANYLCVFNNLLDTESLIFLSSHIVSIL